MKRIISAIIATALILSSLSISAFANVEAATAGQKQIFVQKITR